MNEWAILGLIFVAVTAVIFVSYLWIAGRGNKLQKRMDSLEDDPFAGEDGMVLGKLTEAFAGQSPLTEGKRKQLETELKAAGFYRASALMEYSAIRAVLILIPLLIAGILVLFLDGVAMINVALAGAAFAILGYSIPRVYLGYLGRQRSRQIERGLPMAVDLLSLSLTGGQNLFNSLARVASEIRVANPTLGEELRIVREQAEISNLELAMLQFANRTNIPEVRTLALVLAQSERLGTDIAQTLMEFSTNYRSTMRQRAETQANRASFWMLFPTIFCLWIPSLVILFGPVFHEFYKHGMTGKEAFQNSFNDFNKVNEGTRDGTFIMMERPVLKMPKR